MPQHIDF